MENPTFTQLNSLKKVLSDEEHFGIYDTDVSFITAFEKMTLKQYRYLLFCIFNKKYFTAKDILDKFLKHK